MNRVKYIVLSMLMVSIVSVTQGSEPASSTDNPTLGSSSPLRPYWWGVQVGFNISNPSLNSTASSQFPSSSPLTGFTGGLNFEWKLAHNISFRPELMYVTRSFFYNGNSSISKFISTDLNILFMYRLGLRPFNPYIFIGPFSGIATGSQSYYNSFHAGLLGGIGVDYRLMPGVRVFINGRYNLGMTNLISQSSYGSLYARGFMFLFGTEFSF